MKMDKTTEFSNCVEEVNRLRLEALKITPKSSSADLIESTATMMNNYLSCMKTINEISAKFADSSIEKRLNVPDTQSSLNIEKESAPDLVRIVKTTFEIFNEVAKQENENKPEAVIDGAQIRAVKAHLDGYEKANLENANFIRMLTHVTKFFSNYNTEENELEDSTIVTINSDDVSASSPMQ